MPDSPRPSIAFPAFQTPAGLQPQADREHRSDYAETQGQAQELNRRTDGYWLDLPYSPDRYRADPPATWAIPKGNIAAARYKVAGSDVAMSFWVTGAVSAPVVSLFIQLPDRLIARAQAGTVGRAQIVGTGFEAILIAVVRRTRQIQLNRMSFQNWPATTVEVIGQITIEVEEL